MLSLINLTATSSYTLGHSRDIVNCPFWDQKSLSMLYGREAWNLDRCPYLFVVSVIQLLILMSDDQGNNICSKTNISVPHFIFQSIFETLVNLTLTYYVMSFLIVLSSALAQALSTLYPTSHHLKRSTPIPCLQLSLVLLQ